MKHKLHIAYSNGEDLMREAVASLKDIGNIHVWPNNGAKPPWDLGAHGVTVHELPDLSPVSTINMMLQSSMEDDVAFWAHNDAFAQPGAALAFKEKVERQLASGEKWGMAFSLYDILCAFNMEAVKAVGYWDTMFFQYTSDLEYYSRMKRMGWPLVDLGNEGIEHRGSMTVRRDPQFNYKVQWREHTKFDAEYYKLKWGGPPGAETFTRPFEAQPASPKTQHAPKQLPISTGGMKA